MCSKQHAQAHKMNAAHTRTHIIYDAFGPSAGSGVTGRSSEKASGLETKPGPEEALVSHNVLTYVSTLVQ